MRKDINIHKVDNWEYYKDAYSFKEGLKVKVGSGTRNFKNEQEFLEFLHMNPEDAAMMWVSHPCLQAAANMLNLKINLLTTGVSNPSLQCQRCKTQIIFKNISDLMKHNQTVHKKIETEEEKEGRKVRARWTEIEPDHKMVKGDPKNPLMDIFLMHEDDVHYNLMVHKNHPLAHKDGEDKNGKNIGQDKKIKELESELKKSEDGRKELLIALKECEKVIGTQQEDIERLKIEIKDMSEVMVLTEQTANIEEYLADSNSSNDEQTEQTANKEENMADSNSSNDDDFTEVTAKKSYNCSICKYPFKSKSNMMEHKKKHEKVNVVGEQDNTCSVCGKVLTANDDLSKHIKRIHIPQFNCDDCDFQGTSKGILTKHVNGKHRTRDNRMEGALGCNMCHEEFSDKWNLMNHKRDKHEKAEVCRYYKENKCKFSTENCWFKHELVDKSVEVKKSPQNGTFCLPLFLITQFRRAVRTKPAKRDSV